MGSSLVRPNRLCEHTELFHVGQPTFNVGSRVWGLVLGGWAVRVRATECVCVGQVKADISPHHNVSYSQFSLAGFFLSPDFPHARSDTDSRGSTRNIWQSLHAPRQVQTSKCVPTQKHPIMQIPYPARSFISPVFCE